MNILIPASPGGERAGEPSYTIVSREKLNDTDWEKMWNNFCDPIKGMRFEFNQDEALRLVSSGSFNLVTLDGSAIHLLGATAQTFVDADQEIKVKLLGKFAPSALPTIPAFEDNSPVGTISPDQLSSVFDSMLRAKAELVKEKAFRKKYKKYFNQ